MAYPRNAAVWVNDLMPMTFTLKNIPDDLYEALKSAAVTHRRSLNSEAIVQLQKALPARSKSPEEILARIDALRASLKGTFRAEDIDESKREGRR